jgi:hypothetical protein
MHTTRKLLAATATTSALIGSLAMTLTAPADAAPTSGSTHPAGLAVSAVAAPSSAAKAPAKTSTKWSDPARCRRTARWTSSGWSCSSSFRARVESERW